MQEVTNFLCDAWRTLTESFAIKALLAVIAEVGIYMLGLKHVQVLGIFILLVFLDLITKWSAISYQMLIDLGASPDNISGSDKYIAIPAAWGKGLINSKHMRKPFVTKVLTYCLATAGAWCFDFMAGNYAFAVNLVWLYLGSVEFLSILENMRDGGNSTISGLLELVQSKVDALLKK
nr:MAG TPA: holin [Caudoviricetes sp.]